MSRAASCGPGGAIVPRCDTQCPSLKKETQPYAGLAAADTVWLVLSPVRRGASAAAASTRGRKQAVKTLDPEPPITSPGTQASMSGSQCWMKRGRASDGPSNEPISEPGASSCRPSG